MEALAFIGSDRPAVNSIVRGRECGRFVVLGFRQNGETTLVQLKELGPNDQIGRGELCLPLDCLVW